MTVTTTVTIKATALRPVLSLTTGEGLLAFAVGAVAWFLLRRFAHYPLGLPVWFPLAFCNTLAVSAICAYRFLRGDEAPTVSRYGYGALAHPILQAVLFVLISALGGMSGEWGRVSPYAILAMAGFVASVVAHFVMSGIATARGFLNADCRGEIIALPVFFAWFFILLVLFSAME